MEISDKERIFEDQFYVEDQVLVTGPEDVMKRLLDGQAGRLGQELGVVLEPAGDDEAGRWQLPLGSAEDNIWDCLAQTLKDILPDISECLRWPLGMHRYRIRHLAGSRVAGKVEAVVGFINEVGAGFCVRADPNYLIGYPYSAAGSPYSAAGSPYSAAGSPFTKHGGPVGPDDFWNQWALEKIGLIQNGMRATRRCGRGVRVGVFDTSPFAAEGQPVPAGWEHPPLLTVVHPKVFDFFPSPPPPPLPPGPGGLAPDPPDLSSHGLSVAGLAWAVAPHSDFYLYRVLDKHARGNLFVLCCALKEFMDGVLSSPDAPNGGIINLSLGVPLPAGWWEDHLGAPSIFALEIVLALAHCQGLTVVAAAGNGSARHGPVLAAEFPASLAHVIGVMASNYEDDRSCFSNEGHVAAPGGDGYDCGRVGEECECPWDVAEIERWKYGLIGPVLPERKFPQGFARWLGTSFATPLVSGLAALIIEHHGGLPPLGVLHEILAHANAGGAGIAGGIIGAPHYL
jgi:subtilisin family serine protease